MSDQQDNVLLRRTFSQLLPDVFLHPLWLGFIKKHEALSPRSFQDLMLTAQKLEADGNIRSACQVWFLCSALQKKIGDHVSALSNIQHIWRLAELHNLPQVSRWAAWGACAICFILDDDQQAGRYLEWLQQNLSVDGDWMAADLVNLLKRTLLHQTEERSGIQVMLTWLRCWGEADPFLDVSESMSVAKGKPSKTRSWVISFSRVSIGKWRSFWQTLKLIVNGSLYLKWVERDRPSCSASSLQARLPAVLESTTLLPDIGLPSSQSNEYPQITTINDLGMPALLASPVGQANQAPFVAVYCLGPLRVYRNGHLVENWSSKKGQSIFKYLVMRRDSLVQKDMLMDTFWPDTDPEAARRNLHQAIYSLRQALSLADSDFQYIQFWNDCYRLNPALNIWVDCEEFERHVQAGQRLEKHKKIEGAVAEYGVAEGLYQDDFLIDEPYEEWCQSHRRYLWQTYLSIALRLARYYLECREYAATIALSRRILSKDNCQEEAHQYLMRCYLEQGQHHLALRQYQLCAQFLQDELGLSPSAEMQNLCKQIDRGRFK